MEPTLYDGDHLLVLWGASPRAGEVVVARWPGRPPTVKRAAFHDSHGWWLERDNPREGTDSWSAGPVADADVLGRVLARTWPVIRRRRAR